MIEFVTLFLGLVAGPHPLEVIVGPEVAAVEFVLDGEPVAAIEGEPWRLSFDFGPRLVPHQLEAIAHDADGNELSRTVQWINLPRPRAEAKLSLEGEEGGPPRFARVIWEAIDFEEPRSVEAFLDGRRLKVEDMDRIKLPKSDPGMIHFLTAELEFSDTVSARAEAVFGGTYGDRVSTELTSVVLDTDRSRPPKREQLQGKLLSRGSPLTVVAVERPPMEIIVVREHSLGLFDSIQRLVTSGASRRTPMRAMLPQILRPADRVRFALTASDLESESQRYDQIPVTRDLTQPRAATLLEILTRIGPIGTRRALPEERTADAIAVAGLVAADSNRRRAVILLSAFESPDVSRLSPEVVRDYLNSMLVPLSVWQLKPPGHGDREMPSSWGESTDVTDWGGLGHAFLELRNSLDRQVIVWVEGRHLQRNISVSPDAAGLRLAQRSADKLEAGFDLLTAHRPPSPAAPDITGGASREAPPAGHLSLVDSTRLAQARGMLTGVEMMVPLGPVNIFTDHSSPRLWQDLERLSLQLPEIFSDQYGLQSTLDSGVAVVLFAQQAAYRAYEKAAGISSTGLAGHAADGFIALFSGGRSREDVRRTFMHEVTHLLTLRALGSDLPFWLDEGLAESMTFVTSRPSGELALGPVDPRQLRNAPIPRITGPLAEVRRIIDALREDSLPSLSGLIDTERAALDRTPEPELLYALSAFWVHYLGTVESTLGDRFRQYLRQVSAGEVDPKDSGSLQSALGTDFDPLEKRFRTWLDWLADELTGD